jgi:hypothetical protein
MAKAAVKCKHCPGSFREKLVRIEASSGPASLQPDEADTGDEYNDHGDEQSHLPLASAEAASPFRVTAWLRHASCFPPPGSLPQISTRYLRPPSGFPMEPSIGSRSRARKAPPLEAVPRKRRLDVRVHRVSQGSGVFLHTDTELDEMARLGARAPVEVSLFTRPNAGWGVSAMARSPAGAIVAATAHGQEQVIACLDDARRAAEHGFRSVLIADLGVLSAFVAIRAAGGLPQDMQAKISVMLPAANAAAALVLEQLGASTINLPTDLSLAEIAAIRAAVDCPLDVYVEAPDSIGGFIGSTRSRVDPGCRAGTKPGPATLLTCTRRHAPTLRRWRVSPARDTCGLADLLAVPATADDVELGAEVQRFPAS